MYSISKTCFHHLTMMKGHCEMKCICTTRQDWRLRWNSLNYQKVTSINIYRQSCLSIDVAQYGSLYSLPVPLPCILTMTDCLLISQVAPSPIQDKTYHWRKWTIGGPSSCPLVCVSPCIWTSPPAHSHCLWLHGAPVSHSNYLISPSGHRDMRQAHSTYGSILRISEVL